MSEEIQPVETTSSEPDYSAPPSIDDTLAKTAEAIFAREPARGENGKFQPKVEPAAAAPSAPEIPGKSGTAPPDPQPEVIEAPQSLPAGVKAKWGTLPPDVQKYWASRESEVHQKITADGQRLKDYEGVDSALEVAKDFLESNRIPKAEYIRRLAIADQMLRTNPQQALAEIARMYGIQQAAPTGAQPDPNNALTQTLNDLRNKVSTLESTHQQAALRAAQETIDAFKRDAPHFDAVETLMDELIQSGAAAKVPGDAPLLKKAYDLACHLDTVVRSKIAAEAKAEADKKATEEAKRKAAEDARLAPLARRPGSTPTAPIKGRSWEDTLQRVGAEVYARSA